MLQYIARTDDRYSIAEQIQMVAEGGCTWVQLHVPDLSDEEIRELAREIVPLCKELETILTIEDHIELAKEIGLHGVQLIGNVMKPYDVRELFGPEAIIGVQVGIAAAVLPLRNLDVDYATFAHLSNTDLAANVAAVRQAEIELPIVAQGHYTPDDIDQVIATGVNGVALTDAILNSDDPVAMTQRLISKLKG